MSIIKALVTGLPTYNINLERYLNDVKFENTETVIGKNSARTEYNIIIPDNKNNRLIVASTSDFFVHVMYENEVLSSFEYYKNYFPSDSKPIILINYSEKKFSIKINQEDDELSTFSFDDMESADFLFNFNISTGLSDALKEYYEEIKWLFSEYGSRKYLS